MGARPQFVKLAPVDHALHEAKVEHTIVHTGQHYDPMLSDVFFQDLGISAPDLHLGVGSGSHGHQTGAMLGAMDDALGRFKPDWVLVYGDTNSGILWTYFRRCSGNFCLLPRCRTGPGKDIML